MLPDWAPNAHPLIVHFPIALFFAAVVADLVSLGRKSNDAVAPILYAAAGLGAIAAFFSGKSGADALMVSAHVIADLNRHADWGQRVTIFAALFAVARLVFWKMQKSWRPAIQVPLFVIGLAGAALVAKTADLGGLLVYKHGLGTATAVVDMEMPQTPTVAGEALEGAWTWTPETGLATLLRRASMSGGDDPTQVSIAYLEGRSVLALRGPLTLLIADTVAGLQIDAVLNTNNLSGRAAIIHNATGPEQYHYLAFEEGSVDQGVERQGGAASMAQAELGMSGWHTVRVVGEGTHFHGYVDGQRVTHGHGDTAPDGRVGFVVESGTLYVERISVTPVE